MGSTTLAAVKEYLSTTYDPDREYVDGRVVERNVGERDHSRLQIAIASYFFTREKELGTEALTEQRVQVGPTRFRIPDVCVTIRRREVNQILREPPLICIEILSKDDTMLDMQEKVDDYLAFGVPNVWILNPRNRKAYVCSTDGMREAKNNLLRAQNPKIEVPLGEIFSALD